MDNNILKHKKKMFSFSKLVRDRTENLCKKELQNLYSILDLQFNFFSKRYYLQINLLLLHSFFSNINVLKH